MNFATITSLVASQSTGSVTVRRRGLAAKDARGVYVDGAAVDVVISPVVAHTASGLTGQRLPEGLRADETLRVTQSTERLHDGSGGTTPDLVWYGGAWYRVQRTSDHGLLAGVWTQYATRLERGEEPPP